MSRMLYTVIGGLLAISFTRAQNCSFWLNQSATDPGYNNEIIAQVGDTVTLHAWISANEPSWDWIGGFTFPIVFDTAYLQVLSASIDSTLLGPVITHDSLYMFAGANWPGMGSTFADTLPTQILWYAAVCFSQCLQSDGTPYHVGEARFLVKNSPTTTVTVIDTMLYPPVNDARIGDNLGTMSCIPTWSPVSLRSLAYTRGDANASGGAPNVTDATFILSHLFPAPNFPCERAADCDLDSTLAVSDVLYLLDHIFPWPSLPEPNYPDTCGYNPADVLPCNSFPPCGMVLEGRKVERKVGRREVSLSLGRPEWLKGGSYRVPVELRCSEPVAGFQFTVVGEGIEVTERGCESEGYDYFRVYEGKGRVSVVSLVSLTPSMDGKASGYISPGEHRVAYVYVNGSGVDRLRLDDVVVSDVYGYDVVGIEVSKSVQGSGMEMPRSYYLKQNEPNPFSGVTVIEYGMPEESDVVLEVYNVLGQRVRLLDSGRREAGSYRVEWDGRDRMGRDLSPGVYFYRLTVGDRQFIKKMILLKK